MLAVHGLCRAIEAHLVLSPSQPQKSHRLAVIHSSFWIIFHDLRLKVLLQQREESFISLPSA